MAFLRRHFCFLEGIAYLLLLEVVGSGSSSSHSLRNFYSAVSEPGPGLPQFIAVGYVDDQPIYRYDSITKRAVPQVPWMEKAGQEDAQYWERETQISQGTEAAFRVNLVTLRDRFNQENSTGLHTVQWMYGCAVGPDGRFCGGGSQNAYDGEDFIALDLQTLSWTARVPQALPTKRRWEGDVDEARRFKDYLEEICVPWLRRYLGYGSETLRRTEAPAGRVARKKGYDGQETLYCQLYGFYPKEIEVTWMKDGQDRKPDTFTGGILPNSDGTYHTWLSIDVDPQERDRYRCQVGHDGLLETLELAWKEPASAIDLGLILGILGVLAVVNLVVVIVVLNKRADKHTSGKQILEDDYKGKPNYIFVESEYLTTKKQQPEGGCKLPQIDSDPESDSSMKRSSSSSDGSSDGSSQDSVTSVTKLI